MTSSTKKSMEKKVIPEFSFQESQEANEFIKSITPADFNGLLFSERLATIFAKHNRKVGEHIITLKATERRGVPCIRVDALLSGVRGGTQGIETTPFTVNLTAFVTYDLRTLWQEILEVIKSQPYKFESRNLLEYLEDTDEYQLIRSTVQNKQLTTMDPVKWPRAKFEHFLSEGASLVLHRLCARKLDFFEQRAQAAEQRERARSRLQALRAGETLQQQAQAAVPPSLPEVSESGTPEVGASVQPVAQQPQAQAALEQLQSSNPIDMRFLTLDQDYRLAEFSYKYLGAKQQMIGDGTLFGTKVYGFERTLRSITSLPITIQFFFLPDGHLTNRIQLHSLLLMRVAEMPETAVPDEYLPEPNVQTPVLRWENDLEMWSKFLERKEELKSDSAHYLRRHPEVRAIVADLLQQLLLRKPEDPLQFARGYYASFSCSDLAKAIDAEEAESSRSRGNSAD